MIKVVAHFFISSRIAKTKNKKIMKYIIDPHKIKHFRIPILGIISAIVIFISSFTTHITPQNNEWKAPAYADTIKNSLKNDVPNAEAGRKIYNSICWTCHGKTGKGDGPAAVNLNPIKPANHTSAKVQQQSDGALFWKIATGRGQMASYEKMYSVKERWQLVCFIRTLKQQNIKPKAK